MSESEQRFQDGESVQLVSHTEQVGYVVEYLGGGRYAVTFEGDGGVHEYPEHLLQPWEAVEEERDRAQDEVRDQEAIAQVAKEDRNRSERTIHQIEGVLTTFGVPISSPLSDTITELLVEREELRRQIQDKPTEGT